ncbi:MAG: hypothetical protein IBX44_00855 [Sulfurospirillum sp.]|nr:hypothetical protein [Sulfurospirillum sp.]
MNLYDKIESLYQNNGRKNTPPPSDILKEILTELKEIKTLLSSNYPKTTKIDTSIKEFVAEFRKNLQPNINTNYYPEIEYKGRVFGVNFKGLLYDKATLNLITTQEAFAVYRYFYNKHLNENSVK